MRYQVFRKAGQDQRFRVALDGWPGKPGIQRTFWEKSTLRILAPQEGFPPSRGKGMPFRGDQIEERWKVENPLILHSAEDGYPSQALRQVQEYRTRRHPWSPVSRQQGLPGPGLEFILPCASLPGGRFPTAMTKRCDPGCTPAGPEVGGSGQDPGPSCRRASCSNRGQRNFYRKDRGSGQQRHPDPFRDFTDCEIDHVNEASAQASSLRLEGGFTSDEPNGTEGMIRLYLEPHGNLKWSFWMENGDLVSVLLEHEATRFALTPSTAIRRLHRISEFTVSFTLYWD